MLVGLARVIKMRPLRNPVIGSESLSEEEEALDEVTQASEEFDQQQLASD